MPKYDKEALCSYEITINFKHGLYYCILLSHLLYLAIAENIDVYGRRGEKKSVFEKISRVLEEDIEEHIIGHLEEIIESNLKKSLREEAQKFATVGFILAYKISSITVQRALS